MISNGARLASDLRFSCLGLSLHLAGQATLKDVV